MEEPYIGRYSGTRGRLIDLPVTAEVATARDRKLTMLESCILLWLYDKEECKMKAVIMLVEVLVVSELGMMTEKGDGVVL